MGEEPRLMFRVTSEQKRILETRMKQGGFVRMADYIRSVLFQKITTEEKVDAIYEKVCKNS